MATEPSSISNNTTSSSSSSAADSFIGSLISVTSKSEIRYEGILYYLNPQDSTFGLKDVRSQGTEGRSKDGQEVHPSSKVYEYILFCGSDIKDLKVITNPPVQKEEQLYNDPAIIQSNYHVEPSSSSKPISATSESLTESNLYNEPSASNVRSFSSVLPPHHTGTQLGIWGSSQSTHIASSSYGMPAQWHGYSGAPGYTSVPQQHSLSSTPMLYSTQNQASTTMAATNMPPNVPPGHSFATSSSTHLNAIPTLTSEQYSMTFVDSLSLEPSQPFYHSTLIDSNGFTLPFSSPYQNASSNESQVVNKVVPDPVSSLPVQLLPYSTPAVSDLISDASLRQQPMLTPNLSQPRLSEHSLSKNLYPDRKDMDATGPVSLNYSSPSTTLAVQPPLLPLPPASEKLQSSVDFTQEFDFQAMNEKFKKDEVWGFLGKANRRVTVDTLQNPSSSWDLGDDNTDLIAQSDTKPAYNKDDFFDTISCNSLGHGVRDEQNRLCNRVKLDSQTFGSSQRRTQFGYGGHRVGHGQHHGPYNWGREYDYSYRGRGRYT